MLQQVFNIVKGPDIMLRSYIYFIYRTLTSKTNNVKTMFNSALFNSPKFDKSTILLLLNMLLQDFLTIF